MYDDFDSDIRKMIADAEADIGFDRDAPYKSGARTVSTMIELWSAPGIAVMRALWSPFRR